MLNGVNLKRCTKWTKLPLWHVYHVILVYLWVVQQSGNSGHLPPSGSDKSIWLIDYVQDHYASSLLHH